LEKNGPCGNTIADTFMQVPKGAAYVHGAGVFVGIWQLDDATGDDPAAV
jgi:hypothetical protein